MGDSGRELLQRTVGCGEVSDADGAAGREHVLTGWVQRRRDLGQLIFVELRDGTGLVQIVFDPSTSAEAHRAAERLRNEDVVGVARSVSPRASLRTPITRPAGSRCARSRAGGAQQGRARFRFPVDDESEAHEEARLKHRYLDLRRPAMQRRLRLRHKLSAAARRASWTRGTSSRSRRRS